MGIHGTPVLTPFLLFLLAAGDGTPFLLEGKGK
jgi:hypothetical protein